MPEVTEIEIPENISEYFEPVPGSSEVGVDAANDPEYFKLNMEIPKAVPDYKRWIELCTLILKEKSKDIKVVSWLTFAFYRTEGIKGFNLGLNILLHLMKKYGNRLFPINPVHKVKALQFLSNTRVIKFIENEQIDKGNITSIIDTQKLLGEISIEIKNILPGNETILKSLEDVITGFVESAKQLSAPVEKPERKETPQVIKESAVPVSRPEVEKKAPVQVIQPTVSSEQDIITQLRKNLALLFEFEEDGTKKQRIPDYYQAFGINRMLQWTDLIRPFDNGGITSIEPPNKVIQNLIKEWFTAKNTELLIARIESEFIKENSEFRYWIDAQRYLVLSLEGIGGNYKIAADDIKNQLSALLNRIKDLPQLKFKDKQTPFADSDTIVWLNDEVMTRQSSDNKNSDANTAIVIDDAYNDIKEEYQKIYNDSPGAFEKNLMKMQSDMINDERKKGKFLRRLNIADYCFRHKEYYLARVMSLELKEFISELNLPQWEPALCISLWHLHYMINREIMLHNKDETLNRKLLAEQEELFYAIAKFNGILALNLNKQKR